jgi:transcriptional regulator with XRE-family HTH domain
MMRTMRTRVFGSVLKTMRERAGLSQNQLARLSGLDHSYLSRLESGQRHPSYDTVARLARVLARDRQERELLFAVAGYVPPEAIIQWRDAAGKAA